METSFHPLKDLFDQLGLYSSSEEINKFISAHSPLDSKISLVDANFWNATQRAFLQEELLKDADWAEIIDLLDSQLREYKEH